MITLRLTGFDRLKRQMHSAPAFLDKEMKKGLGDSISMVETQSAKRTPVDTGLLRSSIGGSRGWKWVRGWVASVGTNVRYAIFVHEGRGRHNVGERKFMEKGARASTRFIQKRMKRVMDNLARHITR